MGAFQKEKRIPSRKEIEYLEALVRGVYAKNDLPAGHALTDDDVYLAIPLHKGQISCREFMRGEKTSKPIKAGQQIGIADIEAPYSENSALVKTIEERGFNYSTLDRPWKFNEAHRRRYKNLCCKSGFQ